MVDTERNPWDAPEDDPQPAAAPSTPASAPAEPVIEPASAEPDPDPPGPPGPPEAGPAADAAADDDIDPNRNRVVLIALAAFVVIALAGFLLSRGGNDSNDPAGGGAAAGAGQGAGAGGAGGTTVPAESLLIKGTSDPFSRADNATSLGGVPNGSVWKTQEDTTWGIKGGQAYVAKPDANQLHRNIATVVSGYAAGQAQVKVATMATTAGLIFRYSGECSYWAIEAAPQYATWNITKVDKCVATQIGNTGYSSVADGVTVGVVFTSSTIKVVINGKVVKAIQDGSLAQNPGGVGMTVFGPDASKARFDDFLAGGPDGQGILTGDVGKLITTTTAG